MCALICALNRSRRGYLPHGRMELYRAALELLLVRRDRERDIAVGLESPELEQAQTALLRKIAYWLIRNGRHEIAWHKAVEILERALPAMPAVAARGSAEDILRHLVLRSGLLRQPTSGTLDFIHRTFQDYLGAQAAVDDWDFDVLVEHAHDTQWEDVLRMAVGHAAPRARAELLHLLLERGTGRSPPGTGCTCWPRPASNTPRRSTRRFGPGWRRPRRNWSRRGIPSRRRNWRRRAAWCWICCRGPRGWRRRWRTRWSWRRRRWRTTTRSPAVPLRDPPLPPGPGPARVGVGPFRHGAVRGGGDREAAVRG
ncbi:NACHT domain-containing protein [Streptomyces stramineus]